MVGHRPDVVVITEFRPTLGGQVLSVLADRGLVHVEQAGTAGAESRGNRTVVVSRFPMVSGEADASPPMPACLSRRVLVRRLLLWSEDRGTVSGSVSAKDLGVSSPDGLLLTAAHLPDDWTPSNALAGWAWLASHAIRMRDERHVVVGDLNGSRDPGQVGGSPRHVAHAMGRLWTAGYRDAFLERDPQKAADSGPETTWKSHWGHELRLDHAILSASLVPSLRGASYSHSPRLEGVSDHSAIVVELALDGDRGASLDEKDGKNHEKSGV